MLRGLVLVLIGLNVVLFLWIRSDPGWTQADREPQRLAQQLAPQAIRFLAEGASQPAAGASAARHGGGPVASGDAASSTAAATAASTSTVVIGPPAASSPAPSASSSATAAAASRPAAVGASSAAVVACVESGPLPSAEAAALQRVLDASGVPAAAVGVRADPQPSHWMVYMGRFADAAQWQKKAEELRRLKLPYSAVSHPAALTPGLSLGSYPTEVAAQGHLDDLAKHGVRTARVVAVPADSTARRVQVRLVDPAWEKRLPGERFAGCLAG